MSLFLSLSKTISSHQLLGLPDPRAIAFGIWVRIAIALKWNKYSKAKNDE
ncbi:hypothetical protein [Coleofasciculus sp.]